MVLIRVLIMQGTCILARGFTIVIVVLAHLSLYLIFLCRHCTLSENMYCGLIIKPKPQSVAVYLMGLEGISGESEKIITGLLTHVSAC